MKCSIVVPSFNQAEFLPSCLESLWRQEGVDLEIIVCDGGSTDGSREILEAVTSRLTYWRSYPDEGQAAALREGFSIASGEILGWLNSDDLLLPHALETVVEAFQTHSQASLFYGDAIWIDREGRFLFPRREIDFDWEIFAYGYCYLPQPSTFFRKKAYEKVGGIDPSFQCAMDYDLWYRLISLGPVIHLPHLLSAIRDHEKTKTRRLRHLFHKEEEILRQRYLRIGKISFFLRHLWHRWRRILLRLRSKCYRPLDWKEAQLISRMMKRDVAYSCRVGCESQGLGKEHNEVQLR